MKFCVALLLVGVSIGVFARPCDEEPAKSLPFCDSLLPLDSRVQNFVSQLTLDEKLSQFLNDAPGIDRLNVPSYEWWSEALHGVGESPGVHFGGATPFATSFPQIIGIGATFNRTLFHEMAKVISTEARAMNNAGTAGLTFWAPNVNIIRDPRWGRGQETPGEDPYLTSEYVSEFVPGMQNGEDMKHLKVSACCKHYFDYNMENWHGMDRHHFNAITSAQDIADTYLPMFEACVRRGHSSSLMCSYNEVNGVPSCANHDLMNVIARGAWGFDGYITSDCGAVYDVYYKHKYDPTPEATCRDVLTAGMDIDCGSFLDGYLPAAVKNGNVTESVLDSALFNLFKVQFRLGMFDTLEEQPYSSYSAKTHLDTREHRELALDAARQSIVLLKNEGDRLPLSSPKSMRVAMIGPFANATTTLLGNYGGVPPYIISFTEGLRPDCAHVDSASGCEDAACQSARQFDDAAALAADADLVVVVVGIDLTIEREELDREDIGLPGLQSKLVSQVAAASSSPIVLVVFGGGSIDVSSFEKSSQVGAILWVGYPGQSGGQALADILVGRYNPGARLPFTVYPGSFVNETSMLDIGMRANATSNNPGRTYRFYTGEPVYPFGHGLSYTSFSYDVEGTNTAAVRAYSLASVEAAVKEAIASTTFSSTSATAAVLGDGVAVTVTNTGLVAGSDIVLCFVHNPVPAEQGAPLKQLVGFERVYLLPGQSQRVFFETSPLHFTYFDGEGVRRAHAGAWEYRIGDLRVPVSVA